MPLLLIYSPKLYTHSVMQRLQNISEKLRSQQKHAIRIIFHQNKFRHTQEHFIQNNRLNIYQLNISITFFYIESKRKVPNDILSKFSRPSHHYPISFSKNNYCTFLQANKKQVKSDNMRFEVMEYYFEYRRKNYRSDHKD